MYVILLFDIHESNDSVCLLCSMNTDVLLTADQASCIPNLTLGALQLGMCLHLCSVYISHGSIRLSDMPEIMMNSYKVIQIHKLTPQ